MITLLPVAPCVATSLWPPHGWTNLAFLWYTTGLWEPPTTVVKTTRTWGSTTSVRSSADPRRYRRVARLRLTSSQLAEKLARFPRAGLGFYPTPLQPLPRLRDWLSAPVPILVKREDHNGLALGGNKVRLLEYVLGEALAQGADVFIAGGGRAQSNHGRLCAAAARACGLEPIVFLSEDPTADNRREGNILLHRMLGTDLRIVPQSEVRTDLPRFWLSHLMEREAERLRAEGRRPYVLPGGALPLATLGFVELGLEIAGQLEALGVTQPHVVVTSTGATQAGLVLVATALGLDWTVTGVACAPLPDPRGNVTTLVNETAALLGLDIGPEPRGLQCVDYTRAGYGVIDDETLRTIALVARLEGVLLDPVYTGKGMSAALDVAARLDPSRHDALVFVHTGGTATVFAYTDALTGGLAAAGPALSTSAASSLASNRGRWNET